MDQSIEFHSDNIQDKRSGDLKKLLDINNIIISILDIGKLLNIIMETIKDIMNAEASTLFLYEDETKDLVFKVALGEAGKELTEKYRVKVGQGVAGWVAEKKQPIYINDVYNDERFDPNYDKKTGFNSRAILCVPLLFKGKLLGVIQAINPIDRSGFTDEDLYLFCSFANQAVLAVQNAIFFQNALEEQRLINEVSSAKSFQESLLPAINKKSDGVHIAARSFSAREVGGEFYDIFNFHDNSIGIVIGGIHMKGIPGALNASIVSGAIKGLSLKLKGHPSIIINALNNTITESITTVDNLSLFYGLISPDNKILHFVNAGFAYPIIIRKNIARYLKFKSDSIGKLQELPKKISVKLEPGDYFVIITEGIVNIKNRGAQNMGLKRIMDHLSNTFKSPQDIVDSLIKLTDDFLDGLEKMEDISILALKIED